MVLLACSHAVYIIGFSVFSDKIKDELFEIGKVRELYNAVPGNKKKFMVFKDTYHGKFPDASWQQLAIWLNRNF